MAQIKITLIKSVHGQNQKAKDSVRSLGLRKIGQSTVREDTPVVQGQVFKAQHLVDVEEVD